LSHKSTTASEGIRQSPRGENLTIDSSVADCYEIPSELAHELRSSVFLLGSVISRFHTAKIAYPGGCDIGLRPVDLHLTGLKRLGVEITEENGYIICKCDKLCGNEIMLDCPSVGATAILLDGKRTTENGVRQAVCSCGM